jgi:hypothetical protein
VEVSGRDDPDRREAAALALGDRAGVSSMGETKVGRCSRTRASPVAAASAVESPIGSGVEPRARLAEHVSTEGGGIGG